MNFRVWYEATIKIHLPSVNQTKSFSCGAAALRSIAKHFGINIDEKGFMKILKTTSKNGTDPCDIKKVAKELGLNIKEHENMSLDLLKKYLDEKKPVLCDIQAYGEPKDYEKDKNGHYVVAIGYDNSNIYFEDPVLKGKRGHLNYNEFVKRWHDYDECRKFKRYGIAIWKDKKVEEDKISKSTKIEWNG